MPTSIDLAWAAGFLEGEGTFSSARTSPVASCAQVQREPLERLQRMFGGSILFYRRKQPTNRQDYHVWQVNGIRAAGVMMTLLCLMSPRRTGQLVASLDKWKSAGPNAARINGAKTHCPHGHEYTESNTRVQRNGGGRVCIACVTRRNRARYSGVK